MNSFDQYMLYLGLGVAGLAVLVALGSAFTVAMMALLRSHELPDLEPNPLAGSFAFVVAEVSRHRVGEVLCLNGDEQQYYPARTADAQTLQVGSIVTITSCVSGWVRVERAPLGLSDDNSQGDNDVSSD